MERWLRTRHRVKTPGLVNRECHQIECVRQPGQRASECPAVRHARDDREPIACAQQEERGMPAGMRSGRENDASLVRRTAMRAHRAWNREMGHSLGDRASLRWRESAIRAELPEERFRVATHEADLTHR
ncbi:MAG TPA: hypothetical protein VFS55_17260 [Dokdonella sp.]|nr:hypothetical protein [Dokdonella sp.]